MIGLVFRLKNVGFRAFFPVFQHPRYSLNGSKGVQAWRFYRGREPFGVLARQRVAERPLLWTSYAGPADPPDTQHRNPGYTYSMTCMN